MSLITPDFGLFFWMTVVFLVVLFILWKYGFPVIVKMVDERKAFIDESLKRPMRPTSVWPISRKKVNPSCRRRVKSRLRYYVRQPRRVTLS